MTAYTDFKKETVTVRSNVAGSVQIYCRRAGQGPPVLLLHGYPQNTHMWRFVAPKLAERYTVVAADLRGYGRSSKPKGSDSHAEYSKREMASDMVQAMKLLGHERFSIVAHDRGARVAHRLALDHPQAVDNLMVLDIAPTLYMYDNADMAFAMGYWHWFFLPQPAPGPENVIMSDPEAFWSMLAGRPSHAGVKWEKEDIEHFKHLYFTPECVHASCEDYRAAATIDLEHDRADRDAGKKLAVSKLRVLWGGNGMIQKYGSVLDIWRQYSEDQVEVPEALLEEICDFL